VIRHKHRTRGTLFSALLLDNFFISTIIVFLDISHRPVILIYKVSETEFCFSPHVKTYSVGTNRYGSSLSPDHKHNNYINIQS
jgi:hypothetical protein